jgi:hypothetical protein
MGTPKQKARALKAAATRKNNQLRPMKRLAEWDAKQKESA